MINTSTFVGRLTRDPNLQKSRNGKSMLLFTIAVNNSFNRDNPDTAFLPCSLWGVQAENTAKYLVKGSLVGIEAYVRTYLKNNLTQVIFQVRRIEFLDNRRSSNQVASYAKSSSDSASDYNRTEGEHRFSGTQNDASGESHPAKKADASHINNPADNNDSSEMEEMLWDED